MPCGQLKCNKNLIQSFTFTLKPHCIIGKVHTHTHKNMKRGNAWQEWLVFLVMSDDPFALMTK